MLELDKISSTTQIKRIAELNSIAKDMNDYGIPVPEKVYNLAKKMITTIQTCKYRREFVAGCILAAMKSTQCTPFRLAQLLEATGDLNLGGVRSSYRLAMTRFESKNMVCNTQPTIYVQEAVEKLHLQKRLKGFALRLSNAVVHNKVHIGVSPIALASAIIFITCIEFNMRKPSYEISKLVGCSQLSCRQAYRRILRKCYDMCPKTFSEEQYCAKQTGYYTNSEWLNFLNKHKAIGIPVEV